MFTGIIEELGRVKNIERAGGNLHLSVEAAMCPELKIDQSVAHNGICLTVVSIKGNEYTVTAIQETLDKTNIDDLSIGDVVNLERCMKMGGRLDGHIVQGHVDKTAICTEVKEEDGSWVFSLNTIKTLHQKLRLKKVQLQ